MIFSDVGGDKFNSLHESALLNVETICVTVKIGTTKNDNKTKVSLIVFFWSKT